MLGLRMKLYPEEFWKWFKKHENKYYELKHRKEDKLRTLGIKLARVHPNLSLEFGGELVDGKRSFIITADGFVDAFPYVFNLVEASPLNETRWDLHALIPRTGLDEITFENLVLKPENLYFSYRPVEQTENKVIDLEIYAVDMPVNGETIDAMYVLLDNYIGEYDTSTKFRNIDFHYLGEKDKDLLPIAQLESVVDSL